MIWWMFLRVWVISVSTGVPRIGKKRIRCSGGGNTVMSLIRSSSVWLVFSTLRYQASLAGVVWAVMLASWWSGWWWVENGRDEKNRRALGASAVAAGSLLSAVHALVIRREARKRTGNKKRGALAWPPM